MKLNKTQIAIIKKIDDKRVFDIPSFLKEFNAVQEFRYDVEKIDNDIKNAENGKTYKVLKDGISPIIYNPTIKTLPLSSFSEDDFTQKVATINHRNFTKEVQYQGEKLEINFYNENYVTNNFLCIYDFLTVWEYLKSEGLVLQLSKEVKKEDLSVFFELKENKS